MSKNYISMKLSGLNLENTYLLTYILRKDIYIIYPLEWMVVLTELPLKSFYMFSNKSVKFSIFRIRAETKFIYIDKVFGWFDQRSRNGVNDVWKV